MGAGRFRGAAVAWFTCSLVACMHAPLQPASSTAGTPLDVPSVAPSKVETPVAGPAGPLVGTPSRGESVPSLPLRWTVQALAGNGLQGEPDDGAPALDSPLFSPASILLLDDGSCLFTDYRIHRIRRLDTAGRLHRFAGLDSFPSASGDGGSALACGMAKPYGLVLDAMGRPVVSEYGYSVPGTRIPGRVRVIDPAGDIHRLAGGGQLAVQTGVRALDADLLGPEGMVRDARGRLLIAEYDGHRVVRLEADGTLTVVAGTGEAGDDGDEGRATSARFSAPNGLALHPRGGFVVVDQGAHRIRWVDADGIVHAVAGTGQATNVAGADDFESWRPVVPLGDGGPATLASLDQPSQAVFDARARLWFTDAGNHRVRRVETDGTCSTIVGPPGTVLGNGGEEEPVEAVLGSPDGLAVTPEGDVLLADYAGRRLLRLSCRS